MAAFLTVLLLLAADLKSEMTSLVNTERAFAKLSMDQGVREAFLANLSSESIIFRPNAVRGKEWFEKNPPPAGFQLDWQPAFADIAQAGDLGYTTGPFQQQSSGRPGSYGHYVTVWKKQKDGKWKIAVDFGITHGAGPKPAVVESPRIVGMARGTRSEQDVETARSALIDLEHHFPVATENYPSVLGNDARVYREGSFPFVSVTAIRTMLTRRPGKFIWHVQDAGISSSLDLGYAYGTMEFKPADAAKPVEKGNYVRIWRRQPGRGWRVVLDLVN